jgi:hypothetical protein
VRITIGGRGSPAESIIPAERGFLLLLEGKRESRIGIGILLLLRIYVCIQA